VQERLSFRWCVLPNPPSSIPYPLFLLLCSICCSRVLQVRKSARGHPPLDSQHHDLRLRWCRAHELSGWQRSQRRDQRRA
jgi:hypothetical protein